MFDDNDHRGGQVIGSVNIEIYEDSEGTWHTRVTTPRIKTSDVRKIYKMALITADTAEHVTSRLPLVERMIMNHAEIKVYQELKQQEMGSAPTPDNEKYQTKLPFKELKG